MSWLNISWESIANFVTGAACWELAKQAGGAYLKRRWDKKANKRALMRADLEALDKLIDPLWTLALKYYSCPSHEGATTAQEILHKLAQFNQTCATANKNLARLSLFPIESTRLLSFRSKLSSELHEPRSSALQPDHPTLTGIAQAVENLRDAISDRRFDLT